MLKNYIRTAFRFLKQNKIFSIINALGLSIALAASFIILLYVINELSYNHGHKNRKQIYKVLNYYVEFKSTQSGTPYVLASAMREEFPQIEKAVRTRNVNGFKLKLKDEFVHVADAKATDSEIFDIFTIPMVGNLSNQNLLDDQNSIVLSREESEIFFPGQNPIGKDIIGLVNHEEHVFNVKGVFENLPINSTFRAQCFLNNKWTIDDINESFNITNADVNWDEDFWETWILLSKDANPIELQKQFHAFEISNLGEKPTKNYSLQNLSDVYLGSDKIQNAGIKGDIGNVRLFLAIAILILLVAASNFIILSTAVSTGRAKEIGIRKTIGANVNSIRIQLLSESLLLSILVLPISLFLARMTMPYAGQLFQTKLVIIHSNIVAYILIYLCLTIFIGIASGIYTSAYLSRLKVMDVLKNATNSGKRKHIFRSSLIIIQLVIFCSFVASTLIIRSQYQYALHKDPGYFNKDILLVDLGYDFKGYPSYLNSIKSNPDVIMASGTMEGLPMRNSMIGLTPNFKDKEKMVKIEAMAIDYNFLKTMGISMIEGRDFSEEFGGDMSKSVILNESAIKKLDITDPIGKMMGNTEIIGVIKDFNLHSFHTDIPPLMITMTDQFIGQVAIRYRPGSLQGVLPFLEKEWRKAAPDRPFRYSTIEEVTESLYSTEKNLSNIVSIFALFTLLIAAIGLFGLTLFVARSRTKEIGIKKVFGSSGKNIIYSFLKGNLVMVMVASLLSIPVTIYFMTRWLNKFSYHTTISWWLFAVAFAIATVVVLSTVLIHSFRASRINPIEALRYE
jgi:putative ABC transport system permease protein